ncbi:hypothetical protein BpHYR1_053618 [Brachionus plicatilis]|uniref:Uncharacterized protein n=1 Tax=Brachionus plicatilis TaxID=10195 RepID=A0A3M7PIG3_BRAPC|nr:hypothetical protein BpHYR1_053618 [Brachionus plicatilis]
MVSMVLVPYRINPNFDIVPRVMVTSLRYICLGNFSSSICIVMVLFLLSICNLVIDFIYAFTFVTTALCNFQSCISYQGLQNSANLAETRFQCVHFAEILHIISRLGQLMQL